MYWKSPINVMAIIADLFWFEHQRHLSLVDINHHVSWPLVRNIETLWLLVLKPFWALPSNPQLVGACLNKCVTKFCSLLIALLLGHLTGPNPLVDGVTAKKPLVEAPSGSDSDEAKEAGKEEDDDDAISVPKSDSSNYSMEGDGVV
jgi:hypothetical protein